MYQAPRAELSLESRIIPDLHLALNHILVRVFEIRVQ